MSTAIIAVVIICCICCVCCYSLSSSLSSVWFASRKLVNISGNWEMTPNPLGAQLRIKDLVDKIEIALFAKSTNTFTGLKWNANVKERSSSILDAEGLDQDNNKFHLTTNDGKTLRWGSFNADGTKKEEFELKKV